MKRLLLLLLFMSLISCKESVVDKVNKDFADNQWMSNDTQTFEFKIKRDIQSAEVVLKFSHVFEPGYSTVPLLVTIQNLNDSAPAKDIPVNLILTGEDGTSVSDCSGDICEFSHMLQADGPLKEGNYKVSVQNLYQGKYLPNVLALGISVKKDD